MPITNSSSINTTPSQFLKDAIKEMAFDADQSHQAGRENQGTVPFQPLANEPSTVTQQRAQAQAAASLKQLERAADLEAKLGGLSGYAKVVDLMTTTATMAANVRTKIEALMGPGTPTGPELEAIRVLNVTLASLAALSPAAVWTHPVPDDVEKK